MGKYAGGADAQGALHLVRHVLDALFHRAELVQHLGGVGQQVFALGGEFHAGGHARNDLRAELFLHVFQPIGQGRL